MLQVTANALRQQVTNNEGLSVKLALVLCCRVFNLSFGFLSHHTVVWLGYLVYFGVTNFW